MLSHEGPLERLADSAQSRSYIASGQSDREFEPADSRTREKENVEAAPLANEHFPFDSIVYEQCQYCDRKFFEGKLLLHLKSCKPGKLLKKKLPLRKELTPVETSGLALSKTYDGLGVEGQSIPQANTPRLPAEEEEENEFLKPSELVTRTAYMTKTATDATAFSEGQPRDSLQNHTVVEEPSNDLLESCPHCSRKFAADRITRHLNVCKTVQKERPVFDSKLKRVTLGQMQISNDAASSPVSRHTTLRYSEKPHSAFEPSKTSTIKPKWKVDHENFINSIRSMKKHKVQIRSIQNDESSPASKPLENPDYVECKFCSRRFAPTVAATHIPKCKDIVNRPKPPSDKTLKLTSTNNRTMKDLTTIKELNAMKAVSSIRCLDEMLGDNATVARATNIQSDVLDKPKQLARLAKNSTLFQKKPAMQVTKIEVKEETNTFAGFVKKYEDVVTRTTKFSNVECPHCQRKFNDRAAQRHLPICAQLHRFKRPEKKPLTMPRRGNSCRLEPHIEQFCAHCGFKFSFGHKYCSNCGKKRQ